MIPVTFPSVFDTDGQQQAVVYFLPSVKGLTKWVDYIPVAFNGIGGAFVKNSEDNNGGQLLSVVTNPTGKQAWVDYIPVAYDPLADFTGYVSVDPKKIPGFATLAAINSKSTDIAAAYSTRRLNPKYTGPAIRVRRSSDNAEADIGFGVNGSLDEHALMQHVGAENLVTYSQDYLNSAWSKTGTGDNTQGTGSIPVITANYDIAPDGTNTATRIQLNLNGGTTTTDRSGLSRSSLPVIKESVYTASIYIKALDGTSISTLRDITANIGILAAAQSSFVHKATDVGNGWFRIERSGTTGTTSGSFRIQLVGGTGVDKLDLLVWGAQLNEGSTALDYCKTEGTTRTSGQNLNPQSEADTNWTANGTTPPTISKDVTIDGKRSVSATFTAAMTATGFAGCRATGSSFAVTKDLPLLYKAQVKLSRALTGSESIVVYITGASGSAFIRLNSTNSPTAFTSFEIKHLVTVTGNNYFTIFLENVVASDVTVYLSERQVNEGSVALPYKATTTAAINNGSGFVTRVYEQTSTLNPEVFPSLDLTTGTATAAVSGRTANSFTTTGAGGVIFSGAMAVGVPYRVRIKGNTTATEFRFRNPNNLTGSVVAAAGDFDITADVLWSSSADAYFFQGSAGTTNITEISVRAKRDLTQTTAANQPRIVFAGMMDRMYVAENLLKHSEQFDNAAWQKSNVTVAVVNTVSPPSGVSSLFSVAATGSGASIYMQQVVSNMATTQNTLSMYLKAGTVLSVKVYCYNTAAGGDNFTATYNLSTGTLTSSSGGAATLTNATMIDVGGGWYRCTLVGKLNGTATQSQGCVVYGDNGTFYVAGAQLNTGSTASPYVKTDATVIKLGDRHPLNKPAIRTDGVSQTMVTGSYSIPQPFTRASALQFLNVAGTRVLLDSIATANHVQLYTSGTSLRQYAPTVATVMGAGITANDRATIVESYSGARTVNSYNGTQYAVNPGANSANGVRIGSGANNADYAHSLFGDIIILPKSLGGKPNDKELVSNGTFDTNTNGWTANAGATLASTSGQLVVTQNTASAYGQANQDVPTVVGKLYEYTYTVVGNTGTHNPIVQIGSNDYGPQAVGTYTRRFIATSTSSTITLAHSNSNAVGTTVTFDNISVREVLPDVDRLTLEDDMKKHWGI